MELGLSGGLNSSDRRKMLLRKLNFPEHMSPNAMLQALNLLMDLDELKELLASV
jgi:ribonuclease M5